LRNLVTSFLRYGRIETTETKAKMLRVLADQMITLGKRGDLHARRQAAAFLTDRKVVGHLFSELSPRFVGRDGGYTRLIKTRSRYGDGAPMVLIELTVAETATPAPAATTPTPPATDTSPATSPA
jgi:large subunit ribosomal protein L17